MLDLDDAADAPPPTHPPPPVSSNVGEAIELDLPPIFFTRVRNFFGTSRFRKEQGDDRAVQGAVDTIVSCLRQDGFCTDVPDDFKSFGKEDKLF